ncbi:MAG: Ig-like domain-containing protein, partial [Thermofilum sp.]|nr:Ig-like domain-containing protein [Thermofilum sp.]
VRGPAAGVPVIIDSRTYYTDASGQVRLTVQAGFHCVQVEPRALFDGGWGMYDFYKWWDGLTSYWRCLDLEQDATLTAYVWERRKLVVEWDPGGYVDYSKACQDPCLLWGSGGSWASLYCKYGGSAALQAVPSTGYRFVKWMRALKDGPLQDYSTSNPVAVTVDNGYTVHAVFELVYATVTVQVRALDASGNDRGPVAGVQVRIADKVYTTDASGRASAQVPATDQSVTVEILTTELYFNNGWARYRFYSWSDGDTRTAKSVVVWGGCHPDRLLLGRAAGGDPVRAARRRLHLGRHGLAQVRHLGQARRLGEPRLPVRQVDARGERRPAAGLLDVPHHHVHG